MAGWIKIPLGTKVGLGPGRFVIWGPSAPSQKGHSPRICGRCLSWPNDSPSQLLNYSRWICVICFVNCRHLPLITASGRWWKVIPDTRVSFSTILSITRKEQILHSLRFAKSLAMKCIFLYNNNSNNRFTALCQRLLGRAGTRRNITHPPTWSLSNLFKLLLSTVIHSILPVQFTCLAIFLHNLSLRPLEPEALHLLFI